MLSGNHDCHTCIHNSINMKKKLIYTSRCDNYAGSIIQTVNHHALHSAFIFSDIQNVSAATRHHTIQRPLTAKRCLKIQQRYEECRD